MQKINKFVVSVILVFSMIFGLLTVTALAYTDLDYDLWVNGEQFTSEKTSIVCGDGTATFDADENTLTLENATIDRVYGYQYGVINSSLPNLIIKLVGNNVIDGQSGNDGIDADGGCNITITGSGTLTMNNMYYGTYIGSYDVAGGDLTIKDTTVNVTSANCAGLWVNHNINFINSNVQVKKTNGSYNGIVSNIDGTITIDGGNIEVDTVKASIHMGNTDGSNHIIVLNSGSLALKSAENEGIHVEPDTTNNINGAIKINGGILKISSGTNATNIPAEKITIADGYGYTTGEHLTTSKDVIVEKIIESSVTTYTVTLNPNGGRVTPTSINLTKDSEYGELPTPTNEKDVNFLGWYKEKVVHDDNACFDDTTVPGWVVRATPSDDMNRHNSGVYYFDIGDLLVFDITIDGLEKDAVIERVDINDKYLPSTDYVISEDGQNVRGYTTINRNQYHYVLDFIDVEVTKKVNYTINEFALYKSKITSTDTIENSDHTLIAAWDTNGYVSKYKVEYDVNGGTVHGGELTTRTVTSGDTFTITKLFQMPDEDYHITVHAPEDKWFDAFEISGERYEEGAKITITGNTVIKYLWKDITYVDKVELTIEAPVAGTKIEGEYDEVLKHIAHESINVRPIITLPEGADYTIESGETYWATSGDYNPYVGEIEAGKTYNAVVYVYCEDDSYQFLEEGLEVVVNGEKATAFDSQGFWVTVEYPMEVTKDLRTITFDLNGGTDSGRYPLKILSVEAGSKFTLPKHPELPELTLVENGAYIGVSAPEGKSFDSYEVSGERMNPGQEITINEDTVIKYLWKDIVYIDKVELKVEAPIVGTQIKADYNEKAGKYDFNTLNVHSIVKVADNKIYDTEDVYNYWLSGDSDVFVGKIEKNKDYKTTILLYAVEDGTEFAEDVTVIINGKEITGFNPFGGLLSGYYTITSKTNNTSSGGGGGSSTSSYKITTKIENGTITPANPSVKKNADQEFTFKANEGYEITDVLVDGKSVGNVSSYKLEKVTSKHTIEVKTAKVSAIENIDDWAKDEIIKADEKGLIPETFAKKDATKAITRLDFAAVAVKLYEAIGGVKAIPAQSNPFTDTNDEYVLKAYALGITKGTSETTFTPNVEITREQMATMLTRALTKIGINTEYDMASITRFADDNDLHDWGRLAVYFMSKEEIIKGVGDNRFNGIGNAKVEEAIAIALRIVEKFSSVK